MATVNGSKYHPKHTWLEGIKRWKPQPLPSGLTIDQRQVWEPPIFNYTEFIDDVYDKKRKAVLEYTNGDRARTTEILDIDLEIGLIHTYSMWIDHNVKDTKGRVRGDDAKLVSFLAELHAELELDREAVWDEWNALEVVQKRRSDGTWRFMDLDKWYEEGWSDEDPIVIPPWDSDEEEYDDEEPTKADTSSNPHSSKATRNDVLSRLASLGLEEYMSEQDGEDDDDEASVMSSGSEAYMDARSTLSEHSEDENIPHPTNLVALETT